MSEKLRVRFGDANYGWLPVELVTDKQEFLFTASYVPYDSLYELVEALSVFLKVGTSKIVRWNTEPIEYEFIFSESDGQAQLEVVEYANSKRIKGKSQTVFHLNGSRKFLVLPFWRALRDVETRIAFEQKWQRSFPKLGMQQLGQQIQHL